MTAYEYIYLMNEFEMKVLSGYTVHFSFVSAFQEIWPIWQDLL